VGGFIGRGSGGSEERSPHPWTNDRGWEIKTAIDWPLLGGSQVSKARPAAPFAFPVGIGVGWVRVGSFFAAHLAGIGVDYFCGGLEQLGRLDPL